MAIQTSTKELKNNIPHMCNVNGSIRPSNANILNVFDSGETTPVVIQESSVLGTTSEFKEAYFKGEGEELKIDTPNPHHVEVAHLDPEVNRFCVQGSVNFVPQCMQLTNCQENQNKTFGLTEKVREVMQDIKQKGGMGYLARKYAVQLVNGDILFRNKYAADLRCVVSFQDKGEQELEFDCLADDFGNPEGIETLTRYIEDALTRDHCYFHPVYKIYGTINYGGEVYPSQELDMSSKKILFRNKIYNEPDAAGIHSQKAGNALRKIDTWYSNYANHERAIPVDPFGPDKSRATAMRRPGSGETFYEIFAGLDKLAERLANHAEPDNDAMFFAAMMVRGGVFSTSKGS